MYTNVKLTSNYSDFGFSLTV